jgi:hypothetical protein
VEVLHGVPALRDPNGFISNLKLVDDDGAEFGEPQLIVGLNRIAHATAWQDTVRQAVGGARSGASAGLASDALDWSLALHRIDAASGPGKMAPHRAQAAPANALMRPRDLVA